MFSYMLGASSYPNSKDPEWTLYYASFVIPNYFRSLLGICKYATILYIEKWAHIITTQFD